MGEGSRIRLFCPRCKDWRIVHKSSRNLQDGDVANCRKHGTPMTVGRRFVDANGYIRVQTGEGYEYEHRYLWRQHFGSIPTSHVVHHINGNRQDNRIENLRLMPKRKHDSVTSAVAWSAIRQGVLPPRRKPNKKRFPPDRVINTVNNCGSLRKAARALGTSRHVLARILREAGLSIEYDRRSHATVVASTRSVAG